MCLIKETRRGEATVIAPEAAHCSHAHLDKALIIRGAATVSSRRQNSRRWDRPVGQVAGSRRDPPAGGPQQPAQKPASVDTDGWAPRPTGLPLYPRGVGLYKPPGHPCKGLIPASFRHHIKTAGGPQQPAQKPASVDTDGWAPRPTGLPLYPRGVGLYKPPGHPCKGLIPASFRHHIKKRRERAVPFFLLTPKQLQEHRVATRSSSDHAERLIPFPGTGDVLLAPTMISHPLAYVTPTTALSRFQAPAMSYWLPQ